MALVGGCATIGFSPDLGAAPLVVLALQVLQVVSVLAVRWAVLVSP